jgi:hypothetical protein
MLVSLATTLNYPRACIAAGVLKEHGIFAEVFDDAGDCYGPVVSGGYRLMVEDGDLGEAAAVLNAAVPSSDEAAGELPAVPLPLTIDRSIGTGFIAGAHGLPLLIVLLSLLQRAFLVLVSKSPEHLPPLLGGVTLLHALRVVINGALMGALFGMTAWLLSNYRRRGIPGEAFVAIVTLLLLFTFILIRIL